MSPIDTLLVEEEGADVDQANRDGVERKGGAADSCCNLNCASLHFTVAASMAHMKVKWSDKGKETKKWCKILVIAEGKMSLSWDAKSKRTSITDRMK